MIKAISTKKSYNLHWEAAVDPEALLDANIWLH
jgi:hypothetical protein